eukprot:CAMPEP_0182499710 /NCGR_PEP_ID=MMETSP1321-20130603/7911_1 /TAXON_ID=91990 /ORGANISM="Bolidomonas sp., Strain RCC1657" /LENGTH=58 /DNA_ID=CAMNT_0024703947 /DNA_START=495 /DNA_END=671 /DNA_ORIENTATION=+
MVTELTSPLMTVPYHIPEPEPIVTEPIKEEEGETKVNGAEGVRLLKVMKRVEGTRRSV